MADIRTLKLNLLANFSELTKGLNDAQLKMNKFSGQIQKSGRKASYALAGLAGAAFGAVKAAEDVTAANARLDTVLKDMGFANATKRLTDYAETLETTTAVDAEVIKLTQAKLATFSNLTKTVNTANGAFDRATKAALDMAAAGFGEASTNAVQLGKALQDPIKGINSLARSGITFTAQEKEQIKTLVESGDTLAAQEMILKAVETQVGGTSEATATGSEKMSIAFKNVSESIGMALLPYFEKLTALVIKFTPYLEKNVGVILAIAGAIGVWAVSIKTLQFAIKSYETVIKVATALQWLWNVALTANPIGLIVVAVGLLAAAFVIAYKKIEPFRDLVDSIWRKIKDLGSAIKNSAVGKVVSAAFSAVVGKANGGMVGAGQAVNVGEMGREVFVPTSGGQIIPNHKLNGGGNTFIFNGVIDGESARRSIERLLQDSSRRTGPINLVGGTL